MAVGTRASAVVNDTDLAEHAELVAFFDSFAEAEGRWRRRNAGYHRLVARIFGLHVPEGASVLELGSGSGDLLASLKPALGIGVDASARMTELASSRHPDLTFVHEFAESVRLGATFDYIILSDITSYSDDLLSLFESVAAHSHSRTRVIVQSYNVAWRPILRLAEVLRLRVRKPTRNWISPHDASNMLELTGFEPVSSTTRILMPKHIILLSTFLNGVVGSVWPFSRLSLTWWVVARPRIREARDLSVSIICPCRNEKGNIQSIFDRLPEIGTKVELIFVEGGSHDGTRVEIEQQIATHPDVDARLIVQTSLGKGEAVRAGFAAARNDVLMILDGDLSVDPESLRRFYRVISTGQAELVNGSRLVYDLEPGSMQFLNILGNKLFSQLFGAITGQRVKDTLCGTKVLSKADYELIAAQRSFFGNFDPFGDFDLLFGAARLGLKIIDLPVNYRSRTYGTTNISRFRHGLLLARMTVFAFWKFRIAPVRIGT